MGNDGATECGIGRGWRAVEDGRDPEAGILYGEVGHRKVGQGKGPALRIAAAIGGRHREVEGEVAGPGEGDRIHDCRRADRTDTGEGPCVVQRIRGGVDRLDGGLGLAGVRRQGEVGRGRRQHRDRDDGGSEAGRRQGREDLDGGVIVARGGVDVAGLGRDVFEGDQAPDHGDGDGERSVAIGEVEAQVVRGEGRICAPAHGLELEGFTGTEAGLAARGGDGGGRGDRDVAGDRVDAAVVLGEQGHGVHAGTREGQGVELTTGAVAVPVDPVGRIGATSDVGGTAEVPFLRSDGAVSGHVVAAGGITAVRAGSIAHARFVVGPADHWIGNLDFRFVDIPGQEGIAQQGLVVPGAHDGAARHVGRAGPPDRAEVGVDQGQVVVAVAHGAVLRLVGVGHPGDAHDFIARSGHELQGVVRGVVEHLLHGEGVRGRSVSPIERETPVWAEGEVDVDPGQSNEGRATGIAVAIDQTGSRRLGLIDQGAEGSGRAGRRGHGDRVVAPFIRRISVGDGGGAVPVADGFGGRTVAPIDDHAGVRGGLGGQFKGEGAGVGGDAADALEPVRTGGGGGKVGHHFGSEELGALGHEASGLDRREGGQQENLREAGAHERCYGGPAAGVASNHVLKLPVRTPANPGSGGTCKPRLGHICTRRVQPITCRR